MFINIFWFETTSFFHRWWALTWWMMRASLKGGQPSTCRHLHNGTIRLIQLTLTGPTMSMQTCISLTRYSCAMGQLYHPHVLLWMRLMRSIYIHIFCSWLTFKKYMHFVWMPGPTCQLLKFLIWCTTSMECVYMTPLCSVCQIWLYHEVHQQCASLRNHWGDVNHVRPCMILDVV